VIQKFFFLGEKSGDSIEAHNMSFWLLKIINFFFLKKVLKKRWSKFWFLPLSH